MVLKPIVGIHFFCKTFIPNTFQILVTTYQNPQLPILAKIGNWGFWFSKK
jgi:hypothetical protein